jgi:hypothetical protein
MLAKVEIIYSKRNNNKVTLNYNARCTGKKCHRASIGIKKMFKEI